MRVNIYHEELTDDVEVVETTPDTGKTYIGIRLFLESADALHNRPDDDDRSAVTVWVGSPAEGYDLANLIVAALDQYTGHRRDA